VGNVVTAIDTETGVALWQFGYKYPSPPRVVADLSVPLTGIPGGAVAIDKTEQGGNGFMTDIVFSDLYGNLWEINPADGKSRYKNVLAQDIPVFSFLTDYHPIGTKPTIFSKGGQEFAVFTSGGYADPSLTMGWGYAVGQYLIAVGLNTPTAGTSPTLPMNEITVSPTYLPIKLALGVGEGGYSQATVIGDELFVTTETANVNAVAYGSSATPTGHAYRINVATNVVGTTAIVSGGATTLASNGTKLYSSSGANRQQLATAAAGTTGAAVTAADQATKLARRLWLRTK